MSKKFGNFKLVFLGESAVGKSSIIQRFTRNVFDPYREATIGAAFISRIFEYQKDDTSYKVKYEIWDTAGQERYKSLTPMYYRHANVAIVVYDLTDKGSFDKAKDWIKELQNYSEESNSNDLLIILVGNKTDLIASGEARAVDSSEVEQFVSQNQFLYVETSAKTGENVKELFENFIAQSLPGHLFKSEEAARGGLGSNQTAGSYSVDLNASSTTSNSCSC